jgi:DNA-binding protein Fis
MTYGLDELVFIVVFCEMHTDKLTVFKTLIHEMVHAIMIKQNIKGKSHSREYKRLGKEVSKVLQVNLHEFEKPYCDLVIDEREIFSARGSCVYVSYHIFNFEYHPVIPAVVEIYSILNI